METNSSSPSLLLIGIIVILAFLFFYFVKKIDCATENENCQKNNYLSDKSASGGFNFEKYLVIGGILIFIIGISLTYSSTIIPDKRNTSGILKEDKFIINSSVKGSPKEFTSFPISDNSKKLKAVDIAGKFTGLDTHSTNNGNDFRDKMSANIQNGHVAFWNNSHKRTYCKIPFHGSACNKHSYKSSYDAIGNVATTYLDKIEDIEVNYLSYKLLEEDTTCTDACDNNPDCSVINYIQSNNKAVHKCSLYRNIILSKNDFYDYSLIVEPAFFAKNSKPDALLFNDQIFLYEDPLPLRYWLKDIGDEYKVKSIGLNNELYLKNRPSYMIVDPDVIPGGGDVEIFFSRENFNNVNLDTTPESLYFFKMDKNYRSKFHARKRIPIKYDIQTWPDVYIITRTV